MGTKFTANDLGAPASGDKVPAERSGTKGNVDLGTAAGKDVAAFAAASHTHPTSDLQAGAANEGDKLRMRSSAWVAEADIDAIASRHFAYDDFAHGNDPDAHFAQFTNSGASVALDTTEIAGHPGVITLDTGTEAPSRGAVLYGSKILPGDGRMIFEACIRVVVLSDGTNSFYVEAGWSDSTFAPVEAIYFRYTHSENSGRWVGVARDGGSETTVNSTVSVVAGTWVRLRIEVNAAGTSAEFFVDGVSIGTLSALPSAKTRMQLYINRTVGTASRTLQADYIGVQQDLTITR